MIGTVVKLFLLVATVGLFVRPESWIVALLVGLAVFEGWIVSAQSISKLNPNPEMWTSDEMAVLRKYSLYFRFPFASQIFSGVCSMINLLGFVWVPWLLWQRLWLPAGLLAVNHFLVSALAFKLNPRFFLHDAVENKGRLALASEMIAVDAVATRLIAEQGGGIGGPTGA